MIPFHFCGMAHDYIRTCYRSSMRFWDGENAVLVRGRWFRAPETAELVDGPTVFWSRKTWDRDSVNDGPGEDLRAGTVYDPGANPLGYLGTHHCGSSAAFADGGVWLRDEGLRTDAKGWAECCGLPAEAGRGEALGGGALFVSFTPPAVAGGLAVGGEGEWPVGGLLRKAKQLLALVLDVTYWAALLEKAKETTAAITTEPYAAALFEKAKQTTAGVIQAVAETGDLMRGTGLESGVNFDVALSADLQKAKDMAATYVYPVTAAAGFEKAKDAAATYVYPVTAAAGFEKGKSFAATVT